MYYFVGNIYFALKSFLTICLLNFIVCIFQIVILHAIYYQLISRIQLTFLCYSTHYFLYCSRRVSCHEVYLSLDYIDVTVILLPRCGKRSSSRLIVKLTVIRRALR